MPQVRGIDLGVAPLVGVPLTPSVTTANCAASDLTATWQLAPADDNNNNNDEWVTVGHGLTFTPSSAHLGGSLRVHVAPPSSRDDAEIQSRDAEIQSRDAEILSRTLEIGPVVPMPPRLLLRPRVEVPSRAISARSRRYLARSRRYLGDISV